MTTHARGSVLQDRRGQSLVEFTFLMPILLLLGLGVAEMGYLLLDQHAVTRLTREGSNLISRATTLDDAVAAVTAMSVRPVDLATHSRVIFSVLKKGATPGTGNYDRIFLYRRRESGALAASSKLRTVGGGSFGGAPDYEAIGADDATGLQLTSVPASMIGPRGGLIYVTEVYTEHDLITPLAGFGVTAPSTLYSIAYF